MDFSSTVATLFLHVYSWHFLPTRNITHFLFIINTNSHFPDELYANFTHFPDELWSNLPHFPDELCANFTHFPDIRVDLGV